MESLTYNIGSFLKLLTFNDIIIVVLSFIIIILLLVIYYLVKERNMSLEDDILNSTSEVKKNNSDSLKELTKKIEETYEPRTVKLTDYEEEQENNAIISYKELLNSTKKAESNYVEEDVNDYQNFEVKIRKIDLNDIPKRREEPKKSEDEIKVPMMSDNLEGDFLMALKKLQKELNK